MQKPFLSVTLCHHFTLSSDAIRWIVSYADFDTIEKALSSRKGLKKAWNTGFRGQSLTSEALFYFMELSALPFRSGGNLPCKNGGEGIIKKCGKIKRLEFFPGSTIKVMSNLLKRICRRCNYIIEKASTSYLTCRHSLSNCIVGNNEFASVFLFL